MENCVAPGLDKFDLLLEAVLSLIKVLKCMFCYFNYIGAFTLF